MRPVPGYTDPITGPVPRSAPARAVWRLKHRLRSLAGLRRGFRVERFYYKEVTTELLARALSRKGSGTKIYRVTFPDGAKLMIHCSTRRPYADIMGPVMLSHFRRAQAMIRPGMRVLSIPCGTGDTARWLAERVGPSGAVVALDPDVESIAYAQRRYPLANVAFEVGEEDALAGEVDGSCDAAFIVAADPERIRPGLLAEVWRVVGPGGWVMVGCPAEVTRAVLEQLVGVLKPGGAASGSAKHTSAAADAPGERRMGDAVVDWMSAGDEQFHLAVIRKLPPEGPHPVPAVPSSPA